MLCWSKGRVDAWTVSTKRCEYVTTYKPNEEEEEIENTFLSDAKQQAI